MRAVVQRVSQAQVSVDGQIIAEIGRGVLVLLGVARDDDEEAAEYLAGKVVGLRIFEDESGRMNFSLRDVAGEALVVPNFTLYGDCAKGRRPSFTRAAGPEHAKALFEKFCNLLQGRKVPTTRGVFGAHMEVGLVNDGPVTLIINARENTVVK